MCSQIASAPRYSDHLHHHPPRPPPAHCWGHCCTRSTWSWRLLSLALARFLSVCLSLFLSRFLSVCLSLCSQSLVRQLGRAGGDSFLPAIPLALLVETLLTCKIHTHTHTHTHTCTYICIYTYTYIYIYIYIYICVCVCVYIYIYIMYICI